MTDIEAGAMRAAKSAAQSGRRVTRLVPRRPPAPAPRVEAPHAIPAEGLGRRPPRDPNPSRRRVAPRNKITSRHTPSTSSPCYAGRAKAPDSAARWRRPAGATRPHPRRLRRPYAVPLPRPHRRLKASRLHPAYPGCAKPPNTAASQHPRIWAFRPPRNTLHRTPRRLATRPNSPSTRPKVPLTRALAALTDTRALHGRAMRAERSVRCSIGASTTISCGSALP